MNTYDIYMYVFIYTNKSFILVFSIYSLQLIYQYGYVDKYYLLSLYF